MGTSYAQLYILVISLLMFKLTKSDHIICNSTNPCNKTFSCIEDGAGCLIECNGANACSGSGWNDRFLHRINCANNSDCIVRCNGTNACGGYIHISCALAPHSCTVECYQTDACEDIFIGYEDGGNKGGNLLVHTDFDLHDWMYILCPQAPFTCNVSCGSCKFFLVEAQESGPLTLNCWEGGNCRESYGIYCPLGNYLCDLNIKSVFRDGIIEGGGGDLVIEVNDAGGSQGDWRCGSRTCNVTCTQGGCLDSNTRIDGTHASELNLVIKTSSLMGTSGAWAPRGIHCPADKNRASPKCNIIVSNADGYINMDNILLWAVEGVHDFRFICDHTEYDGNCSYFMDESTTPIIRCTEDILHPDIYGAIFGNSPNCTLDVNTKQCTDNASICNEYQYTFDPTSEATLEPTLEPTSQPTEDPSSQPTVDPTSQPTIDPTDAPTTDPSFMEPLISTNYTISIDTNECMDEEICEQNRQDLEGIMIAISSNNTIIRKVIEYDEKLVIVLSIKTRTAQILDVGYIRYYIEKEVKELQLSAFGDVFVEKDEAEGIVDDAAMTTNAERDNDDESDISSNSNCVAFGCASIAIQIVCIVIICGLSCAISMTCNFYLCHKRIIKRRKDEACIELELNINKSCSDCGESIDDDSVHCVNCLQQKAATEELEVANMDAMRTENVVNNKNRDYVITNELEVANTDVMRSENAVNNLAQNNEDNDDAECLYEPGTEHMHVTGEHNNDTKRNIANTKRKEKEKDEDYLDWNWKDILKWMLSLEGGLYAQYKDDLSASLQQEDVKGEDLKWVDHDTVTSWGIKQFGHKKLLVKKHIFELINNNHATVEGADIV